MPEKSNRLRFEKSPYLLQHKDNPVHWYAWGEEAFQAAREENKPIFLSIGYSTCHWCHVMEHDSFEKQDVADVLNRHFIPIKVDREERPDVDDIYMSAIHAMQQRGGWPLNMFLTPDLKPFFGGTYWPRTQFIPLLEHLAKLWREEPEKVKESGDSLLQYLRNVKAEGGQVGEINEEVFRAFYRNSLVNFDRKWGGFGAAPKFPHAMQLSMLLRIYRRAQDPEALQMVVHTLDKMARGGMYDHLGGGFARYSTDAHWLVPHFEKMLYDNALLAVSYLEAYQITKIEMFERVAREILDYTLRAMTHPEGGFYSAEDADSEGEEGKFYVWRLEELHGLLNPDELDLFCKVYNVTGQGNFSAEGGSASGGEQPQTNILNLNNEYGWDEKDNTLLQSAWEKLFKTREARIHPHKDDKILTSWNGLMIRAMALGYQVVGDEKYLEAAHRAVQFIRKNLFKNGALLARYRDGEGRFAARLEDYSFLIQALIDLYQSDFKKEVLEWALELQGIQDRDFWDKKNGGYFYTDGKDPSILVRSKEGTDGALPNSNAVSILNLLRLSDLNLMPELREKAEKTLRCFSQMLSQYPQAFSQMLMAYDYLSDESHEVAIVQGADNMDAQFLKKLREEFHPNLVLAMGREGETFPHLLAGKKAPNQKTAFCICRRASCDYPLQDIENALEKIREIRPYRLD